MKRLIVRGTEVNCNRSLPRLLAGIAGASLLIVSVAALAEESVDYVDFHLTDGRVCKKCAFRILGPDSPSKKGDPEQIELYNRKGQSTVVAYTEILGINKHPLLRKLYLNRLKNAGITGPIIAPEGYEELKQRAKYRQK